jgi:glyoxylase-like metal-dependent hydrolase (beta-lactamase superfamily II)
MAHAMGKVNAFVLFVKPPGADADWDDTDLRRSAAAIPGVTVLTDENGIEAVRFGGETSGHTMVFDRNGTLIFSGGITASRGHAGSNAGESAVLAALNNQPFERARTPVFGCSLAKRPAMGEGKLCSK